MRARFQMDEAVTIEVSIPTTDQGLQEMEWFFQAVGRRIETLEALQIQEAKEKAAASKRPYSLMLASLEEPIRSGSIRPAQFERAETAVKIARAAGIVPGPDHEFEPSLPHQPASRICRTCGISH